MISETILSIYLQSLFSVLPSLHLSHSTWTLVHNVHVHMALDHYWHNGTNCVTVRHVPQTQRGTICLHVRFNWFIDEQTTQFNSQERFTRRSTLYKTQCNCCSNSLKFSCYDVYFYNCMCQYWRKFHVSTCTCTVQVKRNASTNWLI